MQPIAHLSLPVDDLDAARSFYVDVLGCSTGRVWPEAIDIWFFGVQLTLHLRPDQLIAEQGVRHFGAAVDAATLSALEARIAATGIAWTKAPVSKSVGTPQEERKGLVTDPAGNVIELKTYPDAASAFERPDLAERG